MALYISMSVVGYWATRKTLSELGNRPTHPGVSEEDSKKVKMWKKANTIPLIGLRKTNFI